MESNTISVTFKVDRELKAEAETLFRNLGMNMSTALNLFIRQAVREKRIPFEISMIPSVTETSSGSNE